jgi:hypothetical protein
LVRKRAGLLFRRFHLAAEIAPHFRTFRSAAIAAALSSALA